MANREEVEVLRRLVQHVSRGFYEPKYVIVLDQLTRHKVLKEDDLASRLGLQTKELNKLIAHLTDHRLVEVYRQNELKEGAMRAVGRQYYYLDYRRFCDVVKWRVAEMRRKIVSTTRNELDNKGWKCPQCKRSYSTLEADKVVDPMSGSCRCEDCHAELIDNEDVEEVKGSQDRMQRFNWAMRFVLQGLKKTESMVIPAFDVASWIRSNPSESDRKAAQSGGLKIAGSNPSGKKEDDGVEVVLTVDKDEATRRRERDAEAAAKREQNAMPQWYLTSTISGDATALGIAEQKRAAQYAAEQASLVSPSNSNDAILKGLGTVGITRTTETSHILEDVKPNMDEGPDLYDQYYASLAASTTHSGEVSGTDNVGDNAEEEEDEKPNIQYLDSLNAYRKRSRSREDIVQMKAKMAKLETEALPPPEPVAQAEPLAQDDPVVYVNGIAKPFSTVTEEDHELMTEQEYEAYYNIMLAQG